MEEIVKIKNILILIISITILTIPVVSVVANEDIFSEGTTYRINPTDNMITTKDYTLKVVDFPAPVRGTRTITGAIVPDRPIVPFVKLELYKDIINNTNPIDQFALGIGDEYITSDKEIKIILDNMPGEMSQDWVYEYYNPWADIKIKKRAIPGLSADVYFRNSYNDEGIDENTIDVGDQFAMNIKVKNAGEDIIKNIVINIEDPSSEIMRYKYKYDIYKLDKDEERELPENKVKIILDAPKIIEEKEYEIYINVSGYDKKDIEYFLNTSKKIKVRGTLGLLRANKAVARDSMYLKEYETIVLDIVNPSNLYMNDVQIYDSIPDKTIFIGYIGNIIEGRNYTNDGFFLNKSLIGPGESWSFGYTLKPLEPGIYLLPKFKLNFLMLGRYFEMESNEAGFRVFGPKVLLKKVAKINEEDDDLIDVDVTAKNIGNGFTRILIEDKLPDEVVLVSGKLNLTTFLDSGTEKIMNYTVRIPWDMVNKMMNESNESKKVNISSWPPTKATYYLDDYTFTTLSNETYIPYDKLVWTSNIKEELEMIKKIEEEKEGKEEKEKEEIIPTATIATLPEMNETRKMVVATIPARTPVKTPEKGIPGFRFDATGILIIILILLGRKKRSIKKSIIQQR